MEGREGQIHLAGDLKLRDGTALLDDLSRATKGYGAVAFELSGVRAADSGMLALLFQVRRKLEEHGVEVSVTGWNSEIEKVAQMLAPAAAAGGRKRVRLPAIAQIGKATVDAIDETKALLGFIGSIVHATLALSRKPGSTNWGEVAPLCERMGANAIPIVLLINILVGFVMAFQSAKQLELYGANIYVADLIGISMTRELGPLMTAIILCGRSGAAYAAEIGSMKVNEEIDALRTIGLDPMRWLVMPRVLALALVMPLLTIMADGVGILGGLIVATTQLDLTPRGYFIELATAIAPGDLLTGLMKSVVFAFAIGLIACQQGFSASGGAEGVGQRTTASVVTTLFTLVILDSLFTIVFRAYEL